MQEKDPTPKKPKEDHSTTPELEKTSPEPKNPTPDSEKSPSEAPVKPEKSASDSEKSETPATPEKPEANPKSDNSQKPKLIKKRKILIAIIIAVTVLALAAIIVALVFLAGRPASDDSTQSSATETTADLSKLDQLSLPGNTLSNFDLAFLQLENQDVNKVYSPLSIKYALGMLSDAAGGQTKVQLDTVLGDYQPKSYLNSANRSLANAFLIQDGFRNNVKPDFVATLQDKYNADVIYDAFNDAGTINSWISDKTLGILNQVFNDDDISGKTFILANALAIDMNWQHQIQCSQSETAGVPCLYKALAYSASYANENYNLSIGRITEEHYDSMTFNDKDDTKSVEFGASINNYDIIKDLGADYIRETVAAAYSEWYTTDEAREWNAPSVEEYMDEYMSDLAANYGKYSESTDFYMYDSDAEKVFAKDLQEYDGTTLQYVAIMPKTAALTDYIKNLDAKQASSLIKKLHAIEPQEFKEGVVTTVTGHLPLFHFDYDLSLKDDLVNLGVTDIFESAADLSGMLNSNVDAYIEDAKHKADIEFSNDGIRAAAATALFGAGAGGFPFMYNWDVPVEEIDMTFDNPFLFLIRDKDTGEIWFAGTVYEGLDN